MNQEETRELHEKGQEAWNSWALAILERKKALEDSGAWSTDWFGEGQNPETTAWLEEAKADFDGVEFATDATFDGFVFPGPAVFSRAHFIGKAIFTSAHFASPALFQNASFDGDADLSEIKFYDLAAFDEAAFASVANFEKTEFLRETTGPLVPAARFQKVQFNARADFRTAKFIGNAEFPRARFGNNARFDEADFQAEASFEGVLFEGTVGLVKTRFGGPAKFGQARFKSEARAGEAQFSGATSFEEAEFAGKATFRSVIFSGDTTFQDASFAEDARFNDARFSETVIFRTARFSESAEFPSVRFEKAVDFHGCHFGESANFDQSVFSETADFPSAKFKDGASFDGAVFSGRANFLHTLFRGRTSFRKVKFDGPAELSATQARAAFVLSGAHFAEPPGFHDASFRESPSLDHMTIADPLSFNPANGEDGKSDPRTRFFRFFKASSDPEYAARYARLRKIAAETHDYEREREFFAQELRSRRFWHDKPFGRGLARFWIGWVYGGISDFGRSIARPLALWGAVVLVFSLVYLGQRRADYFLTAPTPLSNGAPLFPSWPQAPDIASVVEWVLSALSWFVLSIFNLFSGGGCISGDTGATGEALFLSLKNSLFFLSWESPDAARRVYSCLYGFETGAGSAEPLVRVPLSVSTAAIIENLVGIMLIVLFLLAVRNLLRAR
ncbi:MAG: pentapeptide repeat-containing protein [Rhodomicrobiaceae bacterium]